MQHEDYEEWNGFTRAHLTDPENLAGKIHLPPPPDISFPSRSPSRRPRSSSQLSPLLSPNSLPPLSPISVSVTPARPAPSQPRYLGSRSRKVKPPRHLMDENGIKMKAHFRIMKMCGGRLGSWGGCRGADQINIEIYVCLARAQTIPMCYFHQGGQSGKHNKNFNSV